SPSRGFEENIVAVESWLSSFEKLFFEFLNGLAVAHNKTLSLDSVGRKAIERYRSNYLALAATVPEFMVWAMLGEHAATRHEVTGLRSDMVAALDANRGALRRVEALLAVQPAEREGSMDLRSVVHRANRGMLDQPIVSTDAVRYGVAVEFPTVGRIYV